MLQSLENLAVDKGLVINQPDFKKIQREDIYRQRILGNKTGAEDFIAYDDRRRVGWPSLLLYLIFLVACLTFGGDRLDVEACYEVHNAIRTAVLSAVYDTKHKSKSWSHIHNAEDLQQWLKIVIPSLLTPAVQGFNMPLQNVRFTIRRVQQITNDDERFGSLTPKVWKHKDGIDPFDDFVDDLEDTNAFGAYRVWGSNEDPATSVSLGWCSQSEVACPASSEAIDKLTFPSGTSASEVQTSCQRWCQSLVGGVNSCRCFDIQGTTCSFYYLKPAYLATAAASGSSSCSSASNLVPQDLVATSSSTAYWPQMLTFNHSSSTMNNGLKPFKGTSGYVVNLIPQDQDILDTLGAAESTCSPSVAQAMKNQLQDFLDGGLVSQGVTALAVDFMTYNANYESYTWTTLLFELSAAGVVSPQLKVSTLRLPASELSSTSSTVFEEVSGNAWDWIYMILLAVLLLWELFELAKRGCSYLKSFWNVYTVVMLLVHVSVFIGRSVYLSRSKFTAILRSLNGEVDLPTDIISAFDEQYRDFDLFRYLFSFAELLLWVKLVHHLEELVPQIRRMVFAARKSWLHILLAGLIFFDLLLAFSVYANLMFGQHIQAYRSWLQSCLTSTKMLFGNLDPFQDLYARWPFEGSVYLIFFNLFFVFIAQFFTKAILLASYIDAVDEEERQKEKIENATDLRGSQGSKDPFSKLLTLPSQTWMGVKHASGKLRKFKVRRPAVPSCGETSLFVLFFFVYIVMVYLMGNVGYNWEISASIEQALRGSPFTKTNALSGQTSYDNNFDTAQSREDIGMWLQEALPTVLFESSAGTIGGAANPLKTYQSALPDQFDQLVINDWNLVVGQEPVRLTFRYHSLSQIPSGEVLAKVAPVGTMVASRDTLPTAVREDGIAFDPEIKDISSVTEVVDVEARTALSKYCTTTSGLAYGSTLDRDATGFSCMLGVNKTQTVAALTDLVSAGVINNQTAVVAADMLIYNGFTASFMYIAVVFGFQPSGSINKHIVTLPVKPDVYTWSNWYRLTMEIFIWILNIYFLIMTLESLVPRLTRDPQEKATYNLVFSKPIGFFVAIVEKLWKDPWCFLELLSCGLTFATLAVWLEVSLASVMQPTSFFFPERPLSVGACTIEWCTDDEVLWAFHSQGLRIRRFLRICGVNSGLVVLRVLKYLKVNPQMQVIFRTLTSAATDLFWCTVLLLVLLIAYVMLGTHLFGMWISGFKTSWNGAFSCVQLFLGTYDPADLDEIPNWEYMVFFYSHIFIFRFVLLNMYFAIIDQHFLAADKLFGHWAGDVHVNPIRRLRGVLKGVFGASTLWQIEDESHEEQPQAPRIQLHHQGHLKRDPGHGRSGWRSFRGSSLRTGMKSFFKSRSVVGGSQPDLASVMTGMDDRDQNLSNYLNTERDLKFWKILPEALQDFAVNEANALHEKILDWQRLIWSNTKGWHAEFDADLDNLLSEATRAAQDSEDDLVNNGLAPLKELHEEQENIAWYIMQREDKLKRLESLKEQKDAQKRSAELSLQEDAQKEESEAQGT